MIYFTYSMLGTVVSKNSCMSHYAFKPTQPCLVLCLLASVQSSAWHQLQLLTEKTEKWLLWRRWTERRLCETGWGTVWKG